MRDEEVKIELEVKTMPGKTTVTKSSVSESEGNGQDIPSLEGERASKELEHKIREQLRAEYSRKETELSEKLEETEERLGELDEKVKLTESEKAEKKRLESRSDSLESQLRIFETDPQFDAAREHISRKVNSAKEEAENSALKRFYNEQVEDLVEEESQKRGISPKELRKELNKMLRAEHMELNPLRRTREAIKELDKLKTAKDKESELAKKEQEYSQFSEDGSRVPRSTTLEEAKKAGDFKSEASALGL